MVGIPQVKQAGEEEEVTSKRRDDFNADYSDVLAHHPFDTLKTISQRGDNFDVHHSTDLAHDPFNSMRTYSQRRDHLDDLDDKVLDYFDNRNKNPQENTMVKVKTKLCDHPSNGAESKKKTGSSASRNDQIKNDLQGHKNDLASLEQHQTTVPVGFVSHVVVSSQEEHEHLNAGSVLWITGTKTRVGHIDAIFGPITKPKYVVRLDSDVQLPKSTHVSFLKCHDSVSDKDKEEQSKTTNRRTMSGEEVNGNSQMTQKKPMLKQTKNLHQNLRRSRCLAALNREPQGTTLFNEPAAAPMMQSQQKNIMRPETNQQNQIQALTMSTVPLPDQNQQTHPQEQFQGP